MIKELWHWLWEFLSHLLTFRWSTLSYHWTNLWMYLWYGFTLYDLGDMDTYLVLKFADMLVEFRKANLGWPDGYTEESWLKKLEYMEELARSTVGSKFEDLSYTEQQRIRAHFRREMGRIFFYLWF